MDLHWKIWDKFCNYNVVITYWEIDASDSLEVWFFWYLRKSFFLKISKFHLDFFNLVQIHFRNSVSPTFRFLQQKHHLSEEFPPKWITLIKVALPYISQNKQATHSVHSTNQSSDVTATARWKTHSICNISKDSRSLCLLCVIATTFFLFLY